MAKFHGAIGFVQTAETEPGVHTEVITEYTYYGEVLRNTRRWEKGENLNDNLVINNQISIISNDYANQNFPNMRYVVWLGNSWRITNVEVARPRLILTVGGVYNGS